MRPKRSALASAPTWAFAARGSQPRAGACLCSGAPLCSGCRARRSLRGAFLLPAPHGAGFQGRRGLARFVSGMPAPDCFQVTCPMMYRCRCLAHRRQLGVMSGGGCRATRLLAMTVMEAAAAMDPGDWQAHAPRRHAKGGRCLCSRPSRPTAQRGRGLTFCAPHWDLEATCAAPALDEQ